MNKEAQRIAIAEACGWKPDGDILPDGTKMWDQRQWFAFKPMEGGGLICDCRTPDYLNDLNAMHEAVNTLSPEKMRDFGYHLQEVANLYCVGVIEDYRPHLGRLGSIANATAEQRAEAFLKTIGKWV